MFRKKVKRFYNRVDNVSYNKGLFMISCYPEHHRTDLWREYYFLDENYNLIMHFASNNCMEAKQLSSRSKCVFYRRDIGDNESIKIIRISDYGRIQKVLDIDDIDDNITLDSHGDDEDSTFAIKKDGLWGFIDYNAEIIIEPQYQYYSDFANGYACVIKDNKAGFIDKENKIVIPFNYELPLNSNTEVNFGYSTFLWHHGKLLAPIAKNNKYGVIDIEENVVIPFMYDYIFSLGEDFCAIKDNKAGIIDVNNNIVLPLEYDDIDIDNDGLPYFYIGNNELYGLFDFEKHDFITPVEYKRLSAYDNVIIAEKTKEHTVLLDRKTLQPITDVYDEIRGADENMFKVQVNGKCAYLNDTGKLVTDFIYNSHSPNYYKNGICVAEHYMYENGYDVINKNGEVLYHSPKYREVFNLGNGDILVEQKNGDFVIKKLFKTKGV